jgi:hypothetical protein
MDRRRIVVRTLSALIGLVVLTAGGWLVYYRATFGTFAWWQVPPRLSYCGRDFDRGATVPSSPPRGFTLAQVMTIEPAGWRVYAQNPTANTSTAAPGLPCTIVLVLKQGDHKFVQYGISGGP